MFRSWEFRSRIIKMRLRPDPLGVEFVLGPCTFLNACGSRIPDVLGPAIILARKRDIFFFFTSTICRNFLVA